MSIFILIQRISELYLPTPRLWRVQRRRNRSRDVELKKNRGENKKNSIVQSIPRCYIINNVKGKKKEIIFSRKWSLKFRRIYVHVLIYFQSIDQKIIQVEWRKSSININVRRNGRKMFESVS